MANPDKPTWTISPRQKEGMELCRKRQFVLFSGPRLTGKTEASTHCVVDHAWRTDRGNVSVVSISQSTGLDSGIWKKIVEVTIPNWIDSGMGMKWVKKPYIANVSKRPACSVTNAFGTETSLQLDSLKFEKEVEDRFKGREFSMMYIPELSHFREKKTFDIWSECLRGSHLRDDQFLFLADTNPADDGEDSWIYYLWFVLPQLTYLEYCDRCRKLDAAVLSESAFDSYKASIGSLTFNIEDNIFLSKERIERLEATYFSDPDLYDRYILGLWKKASTDALFHRVFRPRFHIRGEIETPGNPDPMILIPQPSTSRMPTGWDPGAGVNSAFAIIEKTSGRITLPSGKLVEKSIFNVLDEVVITGEDHSLDEFTEKCVEVMEWWENRMGQPYDWDHWSDRSVFDMKEPRHKKYYHQIIYEASNGLITLKSADRGPGSIQQRIHLLRKLLFEGRIFFSNDKTPRAIEMCRSMRAGTSSLMPIQKGSPHKHIFDAIMYCVASEAYDEIDDSIINRIRNARDEGNDSGVVSVAL